MHTGEIQSPVKRRFAKDISLYQCCYQYFINSRLVDITYYSSVSLQIYTSTKFCPCRWITKWKEFGKLLLYHCIGRQIFYHSADVNFLLADQEKIYQKSFIPSQVSISFLVVLPGDIPHLRLNLGALLLYDSLHPSHLHFQSIFFFFQLVIFHKGSLSHGYLSRNLFLWSLQQ